VVDVFAATYKDEPDRQCRLCGTTAKLTFEHIPPKRCYNDSPRLSRTIRSLVKQHTGPETFRRGLGRRSLCEYCNGWTARQYGPSFANFVAQAMQVVERTPDLNERLLLPFTCVPLLVAKQIAVMAIACAHPAKSDRLDHLRSLVLHPTRYGRPHRFRFWLYLMREGMPRLNSSGLPFALAGLMPFVWCEIALPPLGYVVMADGEDERRIAADLGFADITWFFEQRHNWLDTVFLSMSVLRPVGAPPLQYDGIDEDLMY